MTSIVAAIGLLLPQHAIPSPMKHFAAQDEAPGEQNQSSLLDLDWDAPAECPSRDAVHSQIVKLTGVSSERLHRLKARLTIRPDPGTGWTLTASTDLDGMTGERTLSSLSCESLTDAAALMLALILNPDLARSPPTQAHAQEPAPSVVNAASAGEPRTPALWRLGAHAGAQTGVLENVSWSFSLSLGLSVGHLSFRLMPSLTPPEDVIVSNEPRLGGRLWLGALAGLGCWATELGPIALGPCLGLEGTMLRGRGLGVLHPRDTTAYWASADVALFAGLPVGHGLLIEATGFALVPFRRPAVYLNDVGPVSRPGTVGLKALGGLAWLFE